MSYPSTLIRDLSTLPCLSALKQEELSSISDHAWIMNIPKNEILFLESDPVKFIFVVKSGRIKLFKTSMKGKELVINSLSAKEYFCCAPIYGDGKYPVNAMAVEDSTLVVIPAVEFKDMINASVSEMGMKIIAGLCSRIKYLSNIIENISFKDVEQRVIMALLQLTKEKSGENNIVSLAISHHDIASMTGSVREVVSRTMSRLKKEGIIVDSNNKGFRIDKERLLHYISKSDPPVT
jgi:CRP/FNR family transcriptional regulator